MESFHLLKKEYVVNRGFTLIEMIVVIAIIVVITGVTLVGQTTFNRTLLLTDTAYTVALSIRESQSLGQSSRVFGGAQNAGYGVHFENGALTSYVQYADVSPTTPGSKLGGLCPGHNVVDATNPESRPGNCMYDGTTEQVRNFAFSRGYVIKSFCGYDNTGAVIGCSNGVNGLTTLDIEFLRPNTTSTIIGNLSSGGRVSLNSACIQITEPGGATSRYVKVTQLGEVSVAATCP